MGPLRILGSIASILVSLSISLLIMVGLVEAKLPDAALMGIAGACSLVVIGWGMKGAKPLPKWLTLLCLFPCMMLGICVLLGAYERYSLFSPWLMGSSATVIFVLVCLAASWHPISSAEDFSVEGAPGGPLGKLVSATVVFIFTGVLFFQPLLLLLNGQSQPRPPFIVAGTVAQAYSTHGKGAADYLVLAGPASVFHSTWTAGEFKVDGQTYRTSPVGSRRCLTVRTGILRLRWWSINDC